MAIMYTAALKFPASASITSPSITSASIISLSITFLTLNSLPKSDKINRKASFWFVNLIIFIDFKWKGTTH